MAGLGGSSGSAGAIRAGRAYVEAFLDDNKLNRGLAKMEARLRKAGSALTSVGAKLAVGGGLPTALIASQFVAFDDAIRAAGARAEATGPQLQAMTDKARELGRTTSFTATEVANLMNTLGTAGFNPDQINAMAGAVLNLARASGVDATLAADTLGVAINTFGLQATDATKVSNLLNATAQKSAVTFEDLGFSFKYAAPDAARLGMSMEDLLASIGGLGQMGIRGEMAGTTIRRMLTLTGAQAKKFQEVFGVAAQDAAGDVLPLIDLLESAQQSIAGLGTADQTKKLEEFFGILGITGASSLGRSGDFVRKLRKELGEMKVTAKDVAEQMDAGLGGAFRRFKGAAEGAAISLGGAFAPALAQVASFLKTVANEISGWVGRNQEAAQTLGVVVVSLTLAGAAMLALGLAFKAGAVAVGAFALAVKAVSLVTLLLNPIGLVSAAIAALSVMLIEGDGWTEFANTAKDAWGGIVAAVQKGDLGLAFKITGAGLMLEWAKVMAFWSDTLDDFLSKFENRLEKMRVGVAVPLADAFGKFLIDTPTDAAIESTVADLAGAIFGGKGLDPGAIKKRFDRAADLEGKLDTDVGKGVRDDAARAEKERLRRQAEERARVLKEGADRIAAADAEFRDLIGKAKAPTGGWLGDWDSWGPEVGPMPRKAGAGLAGAAGGVASSVRGAFAVPNARGQFGVGNRVEMQHLTAAQRTAKATEAALRQGERLIAALSFK